MANRSSITKEILIDLYINKKISPSKIADMFETTYGYINTMRRYFGIKTIECWERMNVPRKLSKKELDVILGHLLGDGSLLAVSESQYPSLRVLQSSKQLSFVQQLYGELKGWASGEIKTDHCLDKRVMKKFKYYRFSTVNHPVFKELRKLCYPNNKKTVTEKWLKNISPLGIAIWYQGDGCLANEVMPIFKTNSFSLSEHKLLIKWFRNKFNIESYYRKNDGYYNLCIKDGMKFRKLIEPHIIKYFKYKLPRERKRKGHYTWI